MFVRIRGRSMLPALRSGDLVWCSPPRELRRGQLLLIHKNELLVKRLIGLPGEHVELKQGALRVNQQLVEEAYVSPVASLEPQADQSWQLRENEYCVLGDSRDDSMDSRRWGPIRREEIQGVLTFRVWPAGRFKV